MPGNGFPEANLRTTERRAPTAAGPRPNVGPRVLIRLPDLRQPPRPAAWKRWLGLVLALLGGGSLSAAGARSRAHGKPGSPSELTTEQATVARWRAIFRYLRPLFDYVISHPKTIVSGGLAAAAQFAALVAWHESGRTNPPPSHSGPPHTVACDDAPANWSNPPATQLGRRSPTAPAADAFRQERDHGPQLVDPHRASPAGNRTEGTARPQRDWQATPHAALNRGSCLTAQSAARREARAAAANDPASTRRSHDAGETLAGAPQPRTSGVAWLEGSIIPSPIREASHEPAQPRVH
ncbi:MAG: hypothetical protein JNG90_15855 [Planctomycetaceae bacterium]|nr:hypothetical protein [Planctomycetaceae bacterium]